MTKEEIKLIKEHYSPPFRGDERGMYILDSDNNVTAMVRGWGRLQYKGEDTAIACQKAIENLIVEGMNKVINGTS